MLDSNDDMDGDHEIPFESQDGFKLAKAPPDESVVEVKKVNTVTDAFPLNWYVHRWLDSRRSCETEC